MLPIEKLEAVSRRFQELEHLLCSPEVLSSPSKMQKLNKERTDLSEVVSAYAILKVKLHELDDANKLVDDPDFRDMAFEEIGRLNGEIPLLEKRLELLLLPRDPNDERNTILEIRS